MTESVFSPSGVITFTTDFGHKGPFIGAMKGAVLKRFPSAVLLDITHETSAHWPAEAGFWISRSFDYFPKGTVHVAVVDPGVGSERDILVVVSRGHCFLAPDNGLLTPLIKQDDQALCFCLKLDNVPGVSLSEVSRTFHGRDIFAPVAGELAKGSLVPEELGVVKTDLVPSLLDEPEQQANAVSGVIVTSDNFGNLISNIDAGMIQEFGFPVCEVAGHRMPFYSTYARVKPGEYLALINSFGVVEIARSEQSAALGLGLGRGAPVRVVNETS